MTAVDAPVRWDRTIYRGTDHLWECRRVDGAGDPIIPTSAEAQVRRDYGTEVWIDIDITIDPVDGWMTLSIPEADTIGPEWDKRTDGRWDLEVVVSGQRLRWAQGLITVSQDVTRDD